MRQGIAGLLAAAFSVVGLTGQTWTVRLEEPTGLYRREGEVVRVPLSKLAGHRSGFTVVDERGVESPWQVSANDLLIQASVVPGELPAYRVHCCSEAAPRFASQIHLKKIGMRRIEFGNSRFRIVFDTGVAAVVEAYSLTAGPERMVNLVETSPENPDALKSDIHIAERREMPAVPGVDGENSGWTALGGDGAAAAEVVAAGPLEGRIRIRRGTRISEFVWTANAAGFRWRAPGGFRFAAISAAPYLPFDRYLDTRETVLWPDVSSASEPDGHELGPRSYTKLPGGHAVYYQLANNYGALGIVALDADLEFTAIGSRKFIARKAAGIAEIGVTFPRWDGFRTLLEARKENRMLRQPLLARVDAAAAERAPAITTPAVLEAVYAVRTNAPAATPFHEQSVSLDGDWELAWCEKGCDRPSTGWRVVRVPGTAHVQWLGAEKAMTREAEWIGDKEWWYRRKFQVPSRFQGKRLRLAFEATDYYADVWIDGKFAGRHEGYIDPYELDVTGVATAGATHEIAVRVWTPIHYYWRHRPYTVKGSYGAVDQKPDDITALGITRPVKLIASERGVVSDVAVDTRLTGDGSDAEVEIQLSADGIDEPGYRWEATLAPRNFTSGERYRVTGEAARERARFAIPMKNPRLWWTWDHGKPNLYTLDVRLLSPDGRAVDGKSIAVGIREFEKIGWQFYLNRKRMFIRGTNYYANLFLSEMNRERHGRDVTLMLGMNVNMIRLHCHFSNPEFYDLADERGILIWQDYLEAWYPEDTAFSLRAAALYDNHIRYARNHASVAVWATSDEESLENYRDLTKHLAPRLFLHDPQRRAVVRSTGRYGDAHVYSGWYGGSIWEYAKISDAFITELGATSLPNYETLVKFMPNQWPFTAHADEWTWRKLQIPEALRAWGDPGAMSMKEYIPRTQAYVARLFQIALERARRRKSEGAGGILHFHAIDVWPSVTMAAIDIDRAPTKTYYTVRRSFEPVLASIEYDRDEWRAGEPVRCGIWAINDRWDAVTDARIDWRILDSTGRQHASGSLAAPMAADSSRQVGEVEWKAGAPGAYELRAAVRDSSGKMISENVFEFEVAP